MQEKLSDKHCVPCEKGTPALKSNQIQELKGQLEGGWQVIDEHHLEKTYKFNSYPETIEFVNRIAEVAEEQQHHPDLEIEFGKVKVKLWTHKIGGLSENDFIMAAKIEELPQPALKH